MAKWRDNPEIMAARYYCKQFGRKAAVIVSFEGEAFTVVSYGNTGNLCKAAERIAEDIACHLEKRGVAGLNWEAE